MAKSHFISFFLLASLAFSAPLALGNEIINPNPLTITSSKISPKALPAGANAEVTIFVHLAEKHHAYIEQFKLKALNPKEMKVTAPNVSPVIEFYDKLAKKNKKGIAGDAEIKAVVEVPSKLSKGDHVLELQLRYQACTDDYCLFPKKLSVKVPVEVNASLGGSNSEASFLNLDFNNQSWLWIFFVVFIAGILTSFTPCIFPMIPITLAVLGTRQTGGSKLKGFLLSLAYVLGIATTYSVLGLVAALTGSLFGSFLGHPAVAIALSLLFVAMAFSMMGLFEFRVPDWLTQKLGQAHGRDGKWLTAFGIGAAAGIVASPCVGPVLVAILAYVTKTQQAFLGFGLLFVFALGMGQLFLVLGTFSHLGSKLPRSGPWMNTVKYVFAIIMVILAIYYVTPVIPSPWPKILSIVAALALGVFFLLHSSKEWIARALGLILLFAGLVMGFGFFNNATNGGSQALNGENKPHPEWVRFTPEKAQEAITNGKRVVVDFNAEWCAACKELEAYTFSDPNVLELAKQRSVVWMTFDATKTTEEFEGYQEKYKIMGLPTILLFDSSGLREDLTLTGFEKAEKFMERLNQLN